VSETFKQKVVTFVAGLCEDCPNKIPEEHPEYEGETRNECYGQCVVDRILAALKERVEGMPRVDTPLSISYNRHGCYTDGVIAELEACKSYMLEG